MMYIATGTRMILPTSRIAVSQPLSISSTPLETWYILIAGCSAATFTAPQSRPSDNSTATVQRRFLKVLVIKAPLLGSIPCPAGGAL